MVMYHVIKTSNPNMDKICVESPLFWDPKTQFVTKCSIQLFIDVPLHVCLLITCSFVLGRLSRDFISARDGHPRVSLHPRKFICAIQILAIVILSASTAIYYLVVNEITPASSISISVQTFSLFIFVINIIQVIRKGSEIASSSTTCIIFFIFCSSFTYLYSSILTRKTWTDTPVILSSIIICLRALLTTAQFFKSIPVLQSFDDSLINESLITSNIELRGEESSTIFSRWTFNWVSPLVDRGSRFGSLTFSDLFSLPESMTSNFSTHFQSSSNDDRIWKILVFKFKKELIFAAFLKLIADFSSFFGPVLLNKILNFLESDQKSPQQGILIAFSLFISVSISSLFNCQFNFALGKTTLKMRQFLIEKMYRKLLKTAPGEINHGQVISLISSDCDRIVNLCPSIMASFSCPLQLLIAMILLYQQLGETFLAGVAVALVILPTNKWICTKIGQFTQKMMEAKDERLRIMSEILRGIRQIKLLAWESVFLRKIQSSRGREMKFLKYRKYLDAACVYFWATTPVLVALAAFSCYILTGHYLNSSIVFTSLALFNMMMMPLNAFPWVLNGLVEAWVSMKRLESFLQTSEVNSIAINSSEISPTIVAMENAVFNVSSSFRLGPINLEISRGSFIGIVGKVGSGKSVLLKIILGELAKSKESGEVKVSLKNFNSGMGYLSQDPWIQNATIRNNILFGKNYDYAKYHKILDQVSLTSDLHHMSIGDSTIIGERGSLLSGGQRTRLALGRELYQDYEIYLFDDPFSSLDAATAMQISDCIKNMSGKTRILCVQDPKYLQNCDTIIELESGQISRIGIPKDFSDSEAVSDSGPENAPAVNETLQALEMDDVREVGLVKFSVVSQYVKAAGVITSALVILSVISMQISRNGSDLWLAHWSSSSNTSQGRNLEIYASIGLVNSITTLIRSAIFAYAGIAAAVQVHDALVKKVSSATCNFFDTTSCGRILNRFSGDVWNVDDALPFTLNIFLAQSAGLLFSILITIYGLPIITILIILLIYPYFKLQSFYRWTSRDLKRLSSSSFAPILSLASESVDGRITIRAGNSSSRFIEEMSNKIDTNTGCQYSSKAASEWLNLRLQTMGVSVTTLVAFLAVFLHIWATGYLNAGLVGLALAYSLSLTGQLNGTIQSFTQLESDFVSIERINQCVEIIQSERIDGNQPSDWPSQGAVELKNVSVKYADDFAIRNINLIVEPGQSIGIVGRTGSGKSTLIKALFDMVPISDGAITIDGVQIHDLQVNYLRRKMCCIPQEPFLFEGSVRGNLDPLSQSSDQDLWKAIQESHSSHLVTSLDDQIMGNESSLSCGQRQLLCLARCLLSRSKIVCLDEATAQVDPDTERLIYKTLEESFQDCTVIMIAHKLESVMNCDQVIVMENGRIVEKGAPKDLEKIDGSAFKKLRQKQV